jgi:hypothetical protein
MHESNKNIVKHILDAALLCWFLFETIYCSAKYNVILHKYIVENFIMFSKYH